MTGDREYDAYADESDSYGNSGFDGLGGLQSKNQSDDTHQNWYEYIAPQIDDILNDI